MPSSNPVLRNPNSHFGTLGVLWIVYGVIRLIMAACMLIYASTATLMFGALLNRVADPFTLMGVFHSLYAATIVLSVVCGLLAIFAGLALLGGRGIGRKLALVASILSLCDIPAGHNAGNLHARGVAPNPGSATVRSFGADGLVCFDGRKQEKMFLMAILSVFVLIALVGSLPVWPHSKSWGFGPIAGVSVVILTILILFWTGRL